MKKASPAPTGPATAHPPTHTNAAGWSSKPIGGRRERRSSRAATSSAKTHYRPCSGRRLAEARGAAAPWGPPFPSFKSAHSRRARGSGTTTSEQLVSRSRRAAFSARSFAAKDCRHGAHRSRHVPVNAGAVRMSGAGTRSTSRSEFGRQVQSNREHRALRLTAGRGTPRPRDPGYGCGGVDARAQQG
jgi:hypothetical protein